MQSVATKENFKKLTNIFESLKPQMVKALPKHVTADRLVRVALNELRANKKLAECNQHSLMKCLMVSSALGLEPGLLGHVYFVPYKTEATVIIGYKGMIDLALRSGKVTNIEARSIYENDEYSIDLGTQSTITHKPVIGKDRGSPVAYYAIAKFADGSYQFEVMTIHEIIKIRDKSMGKNAAPWVDHFDEMAKKTVIRRMFKYLPVSIEIQNAVTLDESEEIGKQGSVLDTEFFEFDEETGEVLEKENQADTLADKIK
jgi:recombination protein RecT